jgi:hypothetical protein
LEGNKYPANWCILPELPEDDQWNFRCRRTAPMTRNVALTPGQESVNSQRRTFVGGALAALMAAPRLAIADDDKTEAPNDPFILLLQGIYQPVPAGTGPQSNLGLTTVNLNDSSYSTTQIYPVYGIGGNNGEDNLPKKAIGTFYVQFGGGGHCAYDLPGGDCAAIHRWRFHATRRRAAWTVFGRDVRAYNNRGERSLSSLSRWTQPHGGKATSSSERSVR